MITATPSIFTPPWPEGSWSICNFLKSEGRAIAETHQKWVPNLKLTRSSRLVGMILSIQLSYNPEKQVCLWVQRLVFSWGKMVYDTPCPTYRLTLIPRGVVGSSKFWEGLLKHGFAVSFCGQFCLMHCYPHTYPVYSSSSLWTWGPLQSVKNAADEFISMRKEGLVLNRS